MKVTREQFIDIIKATSADTVCVRYETDVKMNKKQNPFYHQEGRSWIPDHNVTKISENWYKFGKSYSEAVNEAKTSEEDFKAKESYLESVIPNKLYKSKTGDQLYLRVMADDSVTPEAPSYFVDGVAADDSQMKIIDEFEQRYEHKVHTQEAVGIEKPIRVFNYKLEQIISVIIDGETYELR